ncbi:hypothetical protein [Chryseobacterium sp. SIMBA_029]|uniref:hypothetical protein n=1 Tax=Chryseobacterium sp. SIMBA_029 TaxID=3085772 RepID=UPI003979C16F
MKDIKENWLSKFVFPVFIGFLTVYFREALDFKVITEFLGNNSSKFANFFNSQLYLWQIILYGSLIYFLAKLYSKIFNSRSKEERRKANAIKSYPPVFKVKTVDNENYHIKFKLNVRDEDYVFDKFIPYCENCQSEPMRMTRYNLTEFRCSCRRQLDHTIVRDIKSHIKTEVEKYEIN